MKDKSSEYARCSQKKGNLGATVKFSESLEVMGLNHGINNWCWPRDRLLTLHPSFTVRPCFGPYVNATFHALATLFIFQA